MTLDQQKDFLTQMAKELDPKLSVLFMSTTNSTWLRFRLYKSGFCYLAYTHLFEISADDAARSQSNPEIRQRLKDKIEQANRKMKTAFRPMKLEFEEDGSFKITRLPWVERLWRGTLDYYWEYADPDAGSSGEFGMMLLHDVLAPGRISKLIMFPLLSDEVLLELWKDYLFMIKQSKSGSRMRTELKADGLTERQARKEIIRQIEEIRMTKIQNLLTREAEDAKFSDVLADAVLQLINLDPTNIDEHWTNYEICQWIKSADSKRLRQLARAVRGKRGCRLPPQVFLNKELEHLGAVIGQARKTLKKSGQVCPELKRLWKEYSVKEETMCELSYKYRAHDSAIRRRLKGQSIAGRRGLTDEHKNLIYGLIRLKMKAGEFKSLTKALRSIVKPPLTFHQVQKAYYEVRKRKSKIEK